MSRQQPYATPSPIRPLALGLGLAALTLTGTASALEPAWETDAVFEQPESIAYDAASGYLYVSNIAGDPDDANGKGFISRMTLDGEVETLNWASGLNAPKGIDIVGDRLFAADIDHLVEIDLTSGEIVARHEGNRAVFLNDVAAAPDGNVYVSDMMTDAIYRLQDGEFTRWLESSELQGPNGVLVENDTLIIGSWGNIVDGFETDTAGHLKTVERESGAVRSLGDGSEVGHLDGVQPDGDGNYLVTDWMSGDLYRIQSNGEFETLMNLGQGLADHLVLLDQELVILPQMMDGVVHAYRLEP